MFVYIFVYKKHKQKKEEIIAENEVENIKEEDENIEKEPITPRSNFILVLLI